MLNQADKLAPAEVPAVLASLTRLLQAEGTEAHLLAAPIAVSARTGEGVDVLRDLLAQVAAAKSLSLQRTDAQLHATASQLRTYAGGEGTVLAGAYALDAEQKLVKACYSSSQAEQVLQAATASYRRAAGQRTGWILTRWMSRLKADPLRRLHLGQQDETKSASKAEKSAGMLGSDSENAPELVASSLPPLSAAQKAGMANAVRQYSKQMAARIDEPWKRSMKETALSREAELPELLERDMVRIDYGLGRTRRPPKAPRCPCRPCFCCWVCCSVSPRRGWVGYLPPWVHATTHVSCGVACRPEWRRRCSPAWSPRYSRKQSASTPTVRRWTFSGVSSKKPHQDKPHQAESAQKNPSLPQSRRGGILFVKSIRY